MPAEKALSVTGSSSASMLLSTMLLSIIPAEGEPLDVISKLPTAIFNSISNKPANYYDSLVKLTLMIHPILIKTYSKLKSHY